MSKKAMIKRGVLSALVFLFIIVLPSAVIAKNLSQKEIPDLLKPWQAWVLHGFEDYTCPFSYNKFKERFCAWPSQLKLNLRGSSGTFEQTWQVYITSWITLPGGRNQWPQDVRVNNKRAIVVEREGVPVIQVDPGLVSISGRFKWDNLPEALTIDSATGLIDLTINGEKIKSPHIDSSNRLWISKLQVTDTRPMEKGDNLVVNVSRRLMDDVPFMVITHLDINVSGDQREVVLGKALLDNAIPTQLISQLPARLEPNGDLRIQVRPGRWVIEITSRFVSAITELKMSLTAAPWPEQEVWVFDARSYLRTVEIEGVTPIDPRQTSIPENWKRLPTYLMKPDNTFQIKVSRRGNTKPEPNQLVLQRILWLDFNGEGYTIKDNISGTMKRGWRLDANNEFRLGKVTVNGQPQVITTLPDSEIQGVEVRQGDLNLIADARYENSQEDIPVVGWQEDFQQIETTLNLPPGWSLFDVDGVDNVPDTWFHNWTLLDLFLVLILSMAVYRLWNGYWGLVALVTFTLIWQEPIETPRYIWINIFIAIALLRVIPKNTFYKFIVAYRNLSVLALLIIAVPFMVNEVRTGIYPQLERPWQQFLVEEMDAAMEMDNRGLLRSEPEPVSPPSLRRAMPSDSVSAPLMAKPEKKALPERLSLLVDPNATLLTGPGLPDWSWNQVHLSWSGPSDPQQRLNLTLVSPTTNMFLNFMRAGLLLLLCLLVAGVRFNLPGGDKNNTRPSEKSRKTPYLIFLSMVLLCLAVLSVGSAVAEVPDDNMLKELRERLTQPPECLPGCASSPSLSINVMNEILTLDMTIHAQQPLAAPLPAQAGQWLPENIYVNGGRAHGLRRAKDGVLWIALDQGIHQIKLRGRVPDRSYFQLPLMLTPKFADVSAKGWTIDGIKDNGVPDHQIQFSRVKKQLQNQKLSVLESGPLPPFLRVERTLILGLEWFVETQVYRVSASGIPIVVELPLISGESVLNESVNVKGGKVLVNMTSQQSHLSWRSSLEKQGSIRLVAEQTSDWVEVWRLDLSPVWHAKFEGIPVIHQQNQQVKWVPEWHPYPGEQVTMTISRPEGISGKTVTIEHSMLKITPGSRATETRLDFTLRSSQGSQHTITLPAEVLLELVEINNLPQPIRLEGRRVTLPVNPGLQKYTVKWRVPAGVSPYYISQDVDLGLDSVNNNIQMILPEDRWVLLTAGPRLGPAVLFWGVVLVILVLAFILGFSKVTPLRTWHWFLLGVGLSQVHIIFALVVVGWLLAMGIRTRLVQGCGNLMFNTIQISLAFLTIISLLVLFYAIKQGLLGSPDMQISGNGSTAFLLNWYQDHAEETLPQVWVLSVPIVAYRLLMLLWALWLAYSLLGWLRWSWRQYAEDGYWRRIRSKIKNKDSKNTESAEKGGTEKPAG